MTTLLQPTSARPGLLDGSHAKDGSKTGLVSMVVPCYGQLEFTRLCVPRVLRYSRAPYEVLFVDGGGMDGTSEYLEGVAAIPGVKVEIVRAEAEIGLLAACAAGVERASGEYVVLLSNDTVVGERWLNHLVAAAKVAADVGMVGTMSNVCPPPQWVGRLPYRIGARRNGAVGQIVNPSTERSDGFNNPSYRNADGFDNPSYRNEERLLDLGAVEEFAAKWREEYQGKSFEVERLGGSCVLLKAEVCRKIDWSEAGTPFGAIDGDVLGEKVRNAGYRLVCCKDLFLHHFGSRLFVALRVNEAEKSGTEK